MSKKYTELTHHIGGHLKSLQEGIPEVMQGFNTMSQAANKDGVLDNKTKELIALGISVALRCDPCIGFHAKALSRLGASREEVMETLGVAVYMGGGPSVMYSSNAIEAFDEFSGNK